MKRTDSSHRLPIKSWCEPVEAGAWEQVGHLADHPALYHHVALMPDAHEGYGMPIGGVVASQRAVIPNAVGVDIGCGMCAVKTTLPVPGREALKRMMTLARERIPLGFNHRKQKVAAELLPVVDEDEADMTVVSREYEEARTQLGTLGGGNHFIEFQADRGGMLWLMIHSGSRNLGKQVADFYNAIAVGIDRRRRAPLPKEWQLAWLDVDSDEGRSYLAEMQYCVDFALANRRMMMDILMDIVQDEHGGNAGFDPAINIAHNYAVQESHFGRQVWVHRKGATLAASDTIGVIPGSQGTASFIVAGKGNPESFRSCSHGAGRRLSRKQAQRELNLAAEQLRLEQQGILHSIRSSRDLDEAAGAYKDIGLVMAAQDDLVEVVEQLRPLAVIKG